MNPVDDIILSDCESDSTSDSSASEELPDIDEHPHQESTTSVSVSTKVAERQKEIPIDDLKTSSIGPILQADDLKLEDSDLDPDLTQLLRAGSRSLFTITSASNTVVDSGTSPPNTGLPSAVIETTVEPQLEGVRTSSIGPLLQADDLKLEDSDFDPDLTQLLRAGSRSLFTITSASNTVVDSGTSQPNTVLPSAVIETTVEPQLEGVRTSSIGPLLQAEDSKSENSDLDADLTQVLNSESRRIPIPTTTQEVTLSDSDEDGGIREGSGNGTTTPSRYGFRKRNARVSYADIEGKSDEEDSKKQKMSQKKEQLEVCSLTDLKLQKYIKNPNQSENFSKWTLVVCKSIPPERLALMLQFFQKCGSHVDSLFYLNLCSADFTKTLKSILQMTPLLTKFSYQYEKRDDANAAINIISSCTSKGYLKSLRSLKLMSLKRDGTVKEADIEALIESNVKFEELELGDALWEDIKPSTFEKFLEYQKSTLERLIIHGGFKGDANKSRFIIKFPKMVNLTSLVICPKYGFISEMKNPFSKKTRIVRLDKPVEEPFRFAIQFVTDLPRLEKLVLGNLVDIEDLSFSLLRKLKVFRCGSSWNLSIKFPPEGSRQALMSSSVTDIQFPDALKDPSFIPRIATYFPNIKKARMFVPSVPVLRAFFKTMQNFDLEELYLKTQFDFESTMESCLLPDDSDALKRSPLTETQVKTLKEYKHFDDYVRYHNIELPLEQGDLMKDNSAGIRALKSLKVLNLEHIPRILLIPCPDEERKWFDYNCKFLNNTFGFEHYPFSGKCHREIMKMNLDQYNWKNLKICHGQTKTFSDAGYVATNDREIMDLHSDEEDLFIPIWRKGAPSVVIQPSMLLPEYFKDKLEG